MERSGFSVASLSVFTNKGGKGMFGSNLPPILSKEEIEPLSLRKKKFTKTAVNYFFAFTLL